MRTLQLAVDDFSSITGGYYPADLNITVSEVLANLGKVSNDQSSIAGAKGVDSIRMRDVGSRGPALLPAEYANPYYESRPALVTLSSDLPKWTPEVEGIVFYVPLGVKGRLATGYKIYGAGREGLLDLALVSGGLVRVQARPDSN
jgi:hypothetical protein